jgi:hypothetical protein
MENIQTLFQRIKGQFRPKYHFSKSEIGLPAKHNNQLSNFEDELLHSEIDEAKLSFVNWTSPKRVYST